MRFKPRTDAEIDAERMASSGILPLGTYDCEVHSAEDTVSKSGNEMIKIGLRVFDTGGNAYWVHDYLLEAIAHKLRHAALALGLSAAYDAGTIRADDIVGRTCRVRLRIEKDKNGQYPDKNVVVDYLAAPLVAGVVNTAPAPAPAPTKHVLIDDEIPF